MAAEVAQEPLEIIVADKLGPYRVGDPTQAIPSGYRL